MNLRHFVLASLALLALVVYLFVSAPPPLAGKALAGPAIPVERLFTLVEAENDAVRALWTQDIVGAGKAAGLKFDEHWRDADVEAGPLPALFLRATAVYLEKDPARLSLFLGSDFPINPANRFQGPQMEKFHLIKETQAPQFFFAADTGLYTAMYPDTAVASPCVSCHNEHPDSPKKDWKLHEVMGATTWSYPEASVSTEELLRIVAALRRGFQEAYTAYVKKAEGFARRPEIGSKWPKDCYCLPSVPTFMAEVERRTSTDTLKALFAAVSPPIPAGGIASTQAGVSAP
ncbi:MAG TPA: DUF3365 domain-containing protein [Methylococcus sp.]|nr:DUF3365 domain-containing protein [Methylococcus sp.]